MFESFCGEFPDESLPFDRGTSHWVRKRSVLIDFLIICKQFKLPSLFTKFTSDIKSSTCNPGCTYIKYRWTHLVTFGWLPDLPGIWTSQNLRKERNINSPEKKTKDPQTQIVSKKINQFVNYPVIFWRFSRFFFSPHLVGEIKKTLVAP